MNNVVETTNLTKNYGNRCVVDDLDLRVCEGDVYGFLGPNGAGKSTTIRMLTGLVRPSSGNIQVMGRDMPAQRSCILREVGALVESPAFYKYLSARDNLTIFSKLSGEYDSDHITRVLDIVGLLSRANDKVKTFSHGMRQRLGIAQALLPSPKLVILDEPTNGLDPQGMKDVRELIKRLAHEEKVTVFLSSHLLNEVEQVCTRVGIINRGKLVAEGDVAELLRTEVEDVEIKVGGLKKTREVLDKLQWVKIQGESITSGDYGTISVRVPPEQIPYMTRALAAGGVDIYSLYPKLTSLEDLFFELLEEDKNAG